MSIKDWAENEIKLAIEFERGTENKDSDEWDYGVECYKSALKAYKSLAEDGHSGMSLSLTATVLLRLIKGLPLTVIEDTEDIWSEVKGFTEDKKTYQCIRYPALFKHIKNNGDISYQNVGRTTGINIHNDIDYSGGTASKIVEKMFPITLPYYPSVRNYIVYTEDFLFDKKMGDYDTEAIYYIITPELERIEVNKFYKHTNEGTFEITEDEFKERAESVGYKAYERRK